jgi:hypothetical protein
MSPASWYALWYVSVSFFKYCSFQVIPQIIRFAKNIQLKKYVNTFEFEVPDWSGLGTAVLGLISSTFLILSVKTRQGGSSQPNVCLPIRQQSTNCLCTIRQPTDQAAAANQIIAYLIRQQSTKCLSTSRQQPTSKAAAN